MKRAEVKQTVNKRQSLKESVIFEWDEQFHACKSRDYTAAWVHLERAHILAQKMPLLHMIAHLKMLKLALRQQNTQEVLAQFNRLILAWPSSLLGILPPGNVGSSRVGPFVKMEIPKDPQKILSRG